MLLVWLQDKGFKINTRNSSNEVVEDPSLQEITEGGKKTCILFDNMMRCPTYINGGDDDGDEEPTTFGNLLTKEI